MLNCKTIFMHMNFLIDIFLNSPLSQNLNTPPRCYCDVTRGIGLLNHDIMNVGVLRPQLRGCGLSIINKYEIKTSALPALVFFSRD